MSLRLKRLTSEYKQLSTAFQSHPLIRIRPDAVDPPERYEVDFHVKGLELLPNGELVSRSKHTIEIALPADYPRNPPMCKMKTPVFHPNIDVWTICTADHWAAQETLVDLVVRIGQIITYQSYNTKSPLNADAARWCDENEHRLPVDSADLHPPQVKSATDALRVICAEAKRQLGVLAAAHTVPDARKAVDAAKAVLSQAVKADSSDHEYVSLGHERDQLVQHFDSISEALTRLELLDKENRTHAQYVKDISRYQQVTSEAEQLLSRTAELPPPPWIDTGSLTLNHVEELQTDVRRTAQELEKAINAVQHEPPTAFDSIGAVSPSNMPVELRGLATSIQQTEVTDPPPLSPTLPEATVLHQRLAAVTKLLDFLSGALRQYHDHAEQERRLAALEQTLADERDAALICVNGRSVELAAGEEKSIGTSGMLRCRLRTSGSLELTDATGRRMTELDGNRSKVLDGLVDVKGILSVQAISEAEESIRLLHRVRSKHTPLMNGSHVPAWWGAWIEPVAESSVEAAIRTATEIRKSANRRFRIGRVTTMLLDLRLLLRHGADVAGRLSSEQREHDTLYKQLEALAAKGKKKRDGRLFLTPERLAQYESLQHRITIHRTRIDRLSQRLKRHHAIVDKAARDFRTFLERVPANTINACLNSEIKDVAAEVRTALGVWHQGAKRNDTIR